MNNGIMRKSTQRVAVAGLIAGALFSTSSAGAVLIDSFATNQGPLSVTPLTGPLTDGSSVSGGGIIGGNRDLRLSTDSGPSPFSSNAEVLGGVAQLANNTQFSSDLLFQWDGLDTDPDFVDFTGLGGIDLTAGGDNAFEIGLVFDDLPASLMMTVHSMDGSSSSVTFPGTGLIFTEISIFIPYETFFGSADFSNVGAIELLISSPLNGLDISFDYVQTGLAPVPVPGAFLLMSSALLAFGLIRRRGVE